MTEMFQVTGDLELFERRSDLKHLHRSVHADFSSKTSSDLIRVAPPLQNTSSDLLLAAGMAAMDIAVCPSLPKISMEPRSTRTRSRTLPARGFNVAWTPL